MVLDLAEHLTDDQLDLIIPLFVEFRDLNRSMGTMSEAELQHRVEEMARHAVDFVATLQVSAAQVAEMLQQTVQSSGEYVGYATTELFPEALQKCFTHALESGLLERGLLPTEQNGAAS